MIVDFGRGHGSGLNRSLMPVIIMFPRVSGVASSGKTDSTFPD